MVWVQGVETIGTGSRKKEHVLVKLEVNQSCYPMYHTFQPEVVIKFLSFTAHLQDHHQSEITVCKWKPETGSMSYKNGVLYCRVPTSYFFPHPPDSPIFVQVHQSAISCSDPGHTHNLESQQKLPTCIQNYIGEFLSCLNVTAAAVFE